MPIDVPAGRRGGVLWKPWSAEVFARAGDRTGLVFLYLSSTWSDACRELEAEVFNNPGVADRLNTDFQAVAVDVDRRPDIFDRYGTGGVPSFGFLTADGILAWNSNYLQAASMERLLDQFKTRYPPARAQFEEEIREREEKIRAIEEASLRGSVELSPDIFRRTINGIAATWDPLHAGFGLSPKLPRPGSIEVLLTAYHDTGGKDFQSILLRTCEAICEHLLDPQEGGFFRYGAGENWQPPQTEKRAIDNAALLQAFLKAFDILRNDSLFNALRATFAWVKKKLWCPESGAFYASQAADRAYYEPGRKRDPDRAPAVDPTHYTDAVASMASACVRGWALLGDDDLLRMAERALEFLRRVPRRPSGLYAHVADGEGTVEGLSCDSIAVLRLLLDLHEATGRSDCLDEAAHLAPLILREFASSEDASLVDRKVHPTDMGQLRYPRKELTESALMAECLIRLAAHVEDPSLEERARAILSSFPDFGHQYGHEFAHYALAVDRAVRPPFKLLLVTGAKGDTEARQLAVRFFHPRKIILHEQPGSGCLAQLSPKSSPVAFLLSEKVPSPASNVRQLAALLESQRFSGG